MSSSVELSLEQQFGLRSLHAQVQQMSREQAQEMLLKVYQQMMVSDNLYRSLLKKEWGIDSPPCLKEEEPLEQPEFESGFDSSNEFG